MPCSVAERWSDRRPVRLGRGCHDLRPTSLSRLGRARHPSRASRLRLRSSLAAMVRSHFACAGSARSTKKSEDLRPIRRPYGGRERHVDRRRTAAEPRIGRALCPFRKPDIVRLARPAPPPIGLAGPAAGRRPQSQGQQRQRQKLMTHRGQSTARIADSTRWACERRRRSLSELAARRQQRDFAHALLRPLCLTVAHLRYMVATSLYRRLGSILLAVTALPASAGHDRTLPRATRLPVQIPAQALIDPLAGAWHT